MGLYRRNGSRVWRYSLMQGGRRYHGTTRTENRKLAEKVFAQVVLELSEGPSVIAVVNKPKPDVHRFAELVERYTSEHSVPNKTVSSIERDSYSFKQLKRLFDGLGLTEITPSRIAEYKALRYSEGAKPATLAKELQLLRNALSLAIREWEWLEENPFTRVRIEIPKNGIERWLTLDEEKGLLAACPDWLKEIVSFAVDTGMRRNEILSLRWPQVDLDRKTITLLETKNKEKRTVPLNSRVLELLRKKIGRRKDSGYVFPSENGNKLDGHNLSRTFRVAREKAGLLDVRFHDLRHTAGSRMVQAGVDLYTVSLILGHKSLAMTKRYAHHNVESLRHGVEALEKWREDQSVAILLQQGVSDIKKGPTDEL